MSDPHAAEQTARQQDLEPADDANPAPPGGHPLVLYDGECGLCDRSVQFILSHDAKGVHRFATLQGQAGRRFLKQAGLPEDYRGSVLLVDDAGVHSHSTAALRIMRRLDGPAKLMSLGRVVPRPVRDLVYNFIARHRFQWFGHADACRLPSPDESARFLA